MNPALRHQLAHLDRAILALLNERARLWRDVEPDDPGRRTAFSDLTRRNAGPFPAASVHAVFEAADAGCDQAADGGVS